MGFHGENCTGGYYGPDPLCKQCDRDQRRFTVLSMVATVAMVIVFSLLEFWLRSR